MDLLLCAECEHRFYVPGVAGFEGHPCPECGGNLAVDVYGLTSIPLDARFLDPRDGASGVTLVDVREKSKPAGEAGKQIVVELSGYFAVKANAGSMQVSVNRGPPAEAALRVAAVLDGIDGDWEEHFYLPTADREESPERAHPASARPYGHLHLVEQADEPDSNGDRSSNGDQAASLAPTRNTRMRPNALDLNRAFD
jgi:hypothetical protein